MPQYIEHPALLGARMADDLSKQRMNLVGQGISQAADALNRQAAADAQAVTDMLQAYSFMRAKRNPKTGEVEKEAVEAIPSDWNQMFMQEMQRRDAATGMYNPNIRPGELGYFLGPSRFPAARTPVAGWFGQSFNGLSPQEQLMQGRFTPQNFDFRQMYEQQAQPDFTIPLIPKKP